MGVRRSEHTTDAYSFSQLCEDLGQVKFSGWLVRKWRQLCHQKDPTLQKIHTIQEQLHNVHWINDLKSMQWATKVAENIVKMVENTYGKEKAYDARTIFHSISKVLTRQQQGHPKIQCKHQEPSQVKSGRRGVKNGRPYVRRRYKTYPKKTPSHTHQRRRAPTSSARGRTKLKG